MLVYVIFPCKKNPERLPYVFCNLKRPKRPLLSEMPYLWGLRSRSNLHETIWRIFPSTTYLHTYNVRTTVYFYLFILSARSLYIFSCRTQQKLDTAYSDEPFLLVPEIKALSNHSVRILNTSVEVRSPMRLLNGSFSQLVGSTLYKDSIANECYAIQVKKQDLASSRY